MVQNLENGQYLTKLRPKATVALCQLSAQWPGFLCHSVGRLLNVQCSWLQQQLLLGGWDDKTWAARVQSLMESGLASGQNHPRAPAKLTPKYVSD